MPSNDGNSFCNSGCDKIIYNENNKMQEDQQPRVAIITPTYNKKQFWRLMLQNLKHQQYPHSLITWYVCDDSEADKGLHSIIDILKEQLAPIQIVFDTRERCSSLGKKRNILVEMTSEEYILHMDDDDFYQPSWVKTCISGFEKNPEKGVIGSLTLPTLFIHENKATCTVQLIDNGKENCDVYPGCIAYTRKYFDNVQGFDEIDKDETRNFANHNQTIIMTPHAPAMRLYPHPRCKEIVGYCK